MKRASSVALAALLAAGCADVGLEGNRPLEEAEQMPPAELVQAVHAPAPQGSTEEDVIVEGRLWVPWGRPVALADDRLRPVGSAHGIAVYAWAWDRSPYDALFARAEPGHWQGHAPVMGATGVAPAH